MSDLRIHTKIQSHYLVFDASGQLPFSIAFGLCRRSPVDTDPRPLLLDIAGSVLDVPYALANGLLTLHEQDSVKQWVEVDLSGLDQVVANEEECLSLSSPVNRTAHWRDAFASHQSYVDVNSQLASVLQPGKKYMIKLANENLHIKRWKYSDQKKFNDNDDKPSHEAEEAAKLINSKPSAGNAKFTVVKNLCWPPRVEIKMRLRPPSPSSSSPSVTALEISATNIGSSSITIQTKGHQKFLIPWGPFRPEDPLAADNRMRILHPVTHKPPKSSLQVIACATGEIVWGNDQRGTGPLTNSHPNRHPKAEDTVTLKPAEPVIRKIDIGTLVDGLADGQYRIRMQPRGCRWWYEEKEAYTPPLMLESQDEVDFSIKDGKVNQKV